MGDQATTGVVFALIAVAYLGPGRVDALGRFRETQRSLLVVGFLIAVFGNGLLVWATEAEKTMYGPPTWAVTLPVACSLVVVAAAVTVRNPSSPPQRMTAPVSPGPRELIGVPAVCAVYAVLALAKVLDTGRRNRDAFGYAPTLPPAVTDRYANEPLPRYETYLSDRWVIAAAIAVVVLTLATIAAGQAIVRDDDPDRPGVAQHVARLGAGAALIAGTGTALWASRAVSRIGTENREHYDQAQRLLIEAGVSNAGLESPRDLQGAASALETVGNLPNLIGWTLMFLVLGRVFVTNGIRDRRGEVSSPVR
ncbi:putative protein OS=Tsukamurella paurometabola (strain ATCC 8368 / DSM / CCUG 35730 /CIP 100753 / JCM 10117 / KCTC 9821 / NBRC 16120 / NCIMB 702349/ NCTC 13040) OX=521096 GN=Tpau_2086 PE=4 SV=1 [Tsukamurella paurometabola]|uniref:Uncharacterized protein n=1 Tax=Tsukamurella paurometabola (strain ATCC 8368 / DSM 20162 / CCUG 35730 / CIP 100753 / JCM 10117 / KCTC 9821 / NBRC 16120 / NCIMB 702349 / NCTC 13040) TaxID=521096 RepID=D5UPE2_TSUPD|nr:hypothetical protein [Tsukamurella paurometabola]ADG78698.1 hypothetical protein Tpau_2086 [Tsukamurella paurometabola DSM 20162]SUP32788.1 Uncharacterised protein [Tsukamurella paurometabola]